MDSDMELLPCPFCGEAAHIISHQEYHFFVECDGNFNCPGGMMDVLAYDSREELIKNWNTRANPDN